MQLFFILILTSVVSAHGATISPEGTRIGGIRLHLEGEIREGDAEKLEANFEHAKSVGLIVHTISLNSPGGRVAVGASLARTMRARQIKTVVAGGHTCASACFMLFAAGRERTVEETARIGVHSAVVPKVGETDSAKSSTVDTVRFLAELGVPPQILGKMVTTRPDEMAWLTKEDLLLMRTNLLVTLPPQKSYVETATPPLRRDTLLPISSGEATRQAQLLLTEAMSHIRANTPVKAIALMKQARELDPYNPFISSTYGYSLYLANRHTEAREAILLSLQIKKDFSEAYRVLALTVAALNDVEWARKNFIAYYKTSGKPDVAYGYLSSLLNDSTVSVATKTAAKNALSDIPLN
jgi:Clp protease